ncbi:MAG: hypothetical protein NUV40_04335, partial [Patescibacteria group bacterium]|nr:hypothetical protein [Patescibacteria group bacterium]
MISKNEFEYTKVRVTRLENQIFEFENTNPIYLQYETFKRLPYDKQQQLRKDWLKYYEDVTKTSIWALMLDSRDALKRGDIARCKANGLKADEYVSTLPKPKIEDPEFMEYKLSAYYMAI